MSRSAKIYRREELDLRRRSTASTVRPRSEKSSKGLIGGNRDETEYSECIVDPTDVDYKERCRRLSTLTFGFPHEWDCSMRTIDPWEGYNAGLLDLATYEANRRAIIPSLKVCSCLANIAADIIVAQDPVKYGDLPKWKDFESAKEMVKVLLREKFKYDLKVFDVLKYRKFISSVVINILEEEGQADLLFNLLIGHGPYFQTNNFYDPEIYNYLTKNHKLKGSWSHRLMRHFANMVNDMEPIYHPFVRKEQKNVLNCVWGYFKKLNRLSRAESPIFCFDGYVEECLRILDREINESKDYMITRHLRCWHQNFLYSRWSSLMSEDVQCGLPREDVSFESLFHELFKSEGHDLSEDFKNVLRPLCSKSFKEYHYLQQDVLMIKLFLHCMKKLIDPKALDDEIRDLRENLNSEIKALEDENLLSHAADTEKLRSKLKDIKRLAFNNDLSDDYVLMGIMMYKGAPKSDPRKQAEYLCKHVEDPMWIKIDFLKSVWLESCCDETVYRDYDCPLRVISGRAVDEQLLPVSHAHQLKEEQVKNLWKRLPPPGRSKDVSMNSPMEGLSRKRRNLKGGC